jgi:hypothetical protein
VSRPIAWLVGIQSVTADDHLGHVMDIGVNGLALIISRSFTVAALRRFWVISKIISGHFGKVAAMFHSGTPFNLFDN